MGNFIENIIENDLQQGKVKSVVTRFPPEPNGYLHIGHAKAICLNLGIAKKYNGKCNLRFDDTNPSKEDDEYVNSIIEDMRWLGFSGDIYFASDYFDFMYECALKLIKKGKAYVDDITAEQLKSERGTLTESGKNSKNRDRSVEENLKLFQDMKNGVINEGDLVLRAKIDMSSPNMNMRDPVVYRVLKAHHHRQGDKWNIYPMYDFAHPLEDAYEHITHSLCSIEFDDHRPLYDWFIEQCDIKDPPHQYEFARLSMTNTVMSKRYLKKLVDEKVVDGWDDPRMPTLAGLRRRGYTAESIKAFCESIGITRADGEVNIAQLESCIRDELNLNAPRAMAVLKPLELEITNRDADYNELIDLEINPQNPETGLRQVNFSKRLYIDADDFSLNPPPKYHRLFEGAFVRLKGAYIIKCTGCEQKDGIVTKVYAEIIEGTKSGSQSAVKAKGVIHWVNYADAVDVEVRDYDYLFNDNKDAGSLLERINPDSLTIYKAKAEKYLKDSKQGERFQFLRTGYYIRDIKHGGLVFNRIVGLKEGFKV